MFKNVVSLANGIEIMIGSKAGDSMKE